MKSNFNDCLSRVLKDEGGYSNDPSDSGGPTNFGITIADYRRYINPRGEAIDVKKMSIDQAKVIYKGKYWDAVNCDTLSSGVDYTVFDYAVNSGVARAKKVLAFFKGKEGTELIDAINNERTAFLEALAAHRPKDQKFLKGWMARVSRVQKYSRQLAAKRDVSGPTTGATAGIGLWAILNNYLHAHPYLSAAAAFIVCAGVWWVIHSIRNKK